MEQQNNFPGWNDVRKQEMRKWAEKSNELDRNINNLMENLKPISDVVPGQKFRTILDPLTAVYTMRGPAPCPFGSHPDGYNTQEGTWLHANSQVWVKEYVEQKIPVPDELKNIKISKLENDGRETNMANMGDN